MRRTHKLSGVKWTLRNLFCIFVQLSTSTKSCAGTATMEAAQYEVGGPEKLTTGTVPVPVPKEHEILIRVYASAINRADTLQRKGSYPPPPGASSILGLEAAGVVEQLGPEVTKWKKGDRVMALLSGGGNAEYAAVHEGHAMRVPDALSLRDAAAIPEVWLTAYQLLHFVGKVQEGDTVLIHAGGSGVGTAAVQLARLAGAVSIVTAGSAAKIDTAKSLGAAHGFNYKEENFAEKVLEVTDGKGVNVVLDCVGSSYWEKNVASLAPDGRWVLYGLMGGGEVNGALLSQILRKRIRLQGTTLRARTTEYKSELVSQFSAHALPRFAGGTLRVIVDRVFPLRDVGEAHRVMESNVTTGKLVLEVRKEAGDHSEL